VEKTMKIEGMRCMGCANAVSKALSDVEGVVKVEVSVTEGKAFVAFDDKKVTWDILKDKVIKAGYKVIS
jgi:copper chaperone CopZ